MTFVGAGGSELSEFVADHVLRHEDRDMLAAVVDGDRVADHIGRDGRAAAPRFEEFLFAGLVHRVDLHHKVVVHKESFFKTACHGSSFVFGWPCGQSFSLSVDRLPISAPSSCSSVEQ